VSDQWELELADIRSLASNNDGHKFVLNSIYASKFAYSVPTRAKTVEAVVSAFHSIVTRTLGRRPLSVRPDNANVLVNAKFRILLNGKGIERNCEEIPS
jgi:hypothetical protein